MIYLDSSVVLAEILVEDERPPESLWQEPLVASRMLQYEVWNRIHAYRLGRSHGENARALLGRVALVEMAAPVLERALEAFEEPVRTLNGLHLATMSFLRDAGQEVSLASYDERLRQAARRLGIPLAP